MDEHDFAFPQHWVDNDGNGGGYFGLTKREYFAAMAMQGLMSNLEAIRREGFVDRDIEEFAIMRADALIAALNTEPKA